MTRTSSCAKVSPPTRTGEPPALGTLSSIHGLTRSNCCSLLLAYTLADIEEGKPDLPACYAIYDSLIEHLNARVAQLEAEVAAETADAVAERDEAHQKEVEVRVAAGGEDDSVEEREKHAAEIEELKKEVADKKRPHIETVKKAIASAWIAEMRFARRSDVRSFVQVRSQSLRIAEHRVANAGSQAGAQHLSACEEVAQSRLAGGRGIRCALHILASAENAD